jgi:predicted GNAT family acetyltransferase
MKIQLEQNGNRGAFFIEEDGERLAEMVFSQAGPDKIIVDHTEVSDKLRGKGAGKQLVAEAVDYARKNKIKIVPLCPFTKSVIDKTPEYQDVLF